MYEVEVEKILRENVPGFADAALSVARGIHNQVLRGGDPVRNVVDLLHGVWLGHPLHVVLTDVTIGAWMFGSTLDLLSIPNRSDGLEKAADTLISLGNLSAVPTALAGIADYSAASRGAMATAATHGLLNASGLALNLLSWRSRRSGKRGLGIFLSSLTTGVLLVSAWLGGHLVYKHQVGVTRIPKTAGPDDWQAVLPDQELPEGTPKRVEVDGSPVLLYRYLDQVHAIGAVCGHAGAPLEEGSFEGHHVTCPWHQSVYDVRDGSIVHGPTLYPEPAYETRTQNGQIEIRRREE